MKAYFFLLASFIATELFSQHLPEESKFHLRGKVNGTKSGIVSLNYINEFGIEIVDSCRIVDGKFSFDGKLINPVPVTLRGDVRSKADDDPNCAQFYLSQGTQNILLEKDHFKSFVLFGSLTQIENESLNRMISEIKNPSDNYLDSLVSVTKYFIRENPHSYVSPFELLLIMSLIPADTAINLYNRLGDPIRESYFGQKVYSKFQRIENTSEGKTAPVFSGIDINGKPVSLSDYRGKYVLLDFWASWCIPCRKENPNMIELFKKYHAKGLEIIGISSDEDKNSWRSAIKNDGIGLWNHILNVPQVKENEIEKDLLTISSQYGVLGLPTKVLVDTKGKIIKRFPYGQGEPTLEESLKMIFKD